MRVPVWSHDANPSIDPRLCKQSLTYCKSQVEIGWLRWINPDDFSKGCIATQRFRIREFEGREHKMSAGTIQAAWGIFQSGHGGPFVWQMRRERLSAQ